MSVKLKKCIDQLKEQGKEGAAAETICNAAIKDASFNVSFTDKAVYDKNTRTVISVRDGVQKYLGSELGKEPVDKFFYIYRAPETIKEFAGEMEGLPLTDGHVSLDRPPTEIVGAVLDARIVDSIDPVINSTIGVQNKVNLDTEISNRELSLGYHADLIPCELYDFEQVGIIPHHLAIVEKGRCGEVCQFTDKENDSMKKKMNAAFLDAEGMLNMQQVLQLVADLPEAIKTMPMDLLKKLIPSLQKAMEMSQAGSKPAETPPAETPTDDAGVEVEKETTTEVEDEGEPATVLDPEKKAMADAAAKVAFSDAVKLEVAKENKLYATVLAKAKDFLPSTFDFADKCPNDIMRAALLTQHKDSFEDAELPTAFKMLKNVKLYDNFAKKEGSPLAELAGKEI